MCDLSVVDVLLFAQVWLGWSVYAGYGELGG